MWNWPVFIFRCQFGSAKRHIVTVELTVANTVSEHTFHPPQSAALCYESLCAYACACASVLPDSLEPDPIVIWVATPHTRQSRIMSSSVVLSLQWFDSCCNSVTDAATLSWLLSLWVIFIPLYGNGWLRHVIRFYQCYNFTFCRGKNLGANPNPFL